MNGGDLNICWHCHIDKNYTASTTTIEVGSTVELGHYPQTASGTDSTPIEWLVLDVQDGKALLISHYGLDTKPYNTDYVDITWEQCTLRTWLNNDFISTAFTADEQEAILLTNVDNSRAQCYSGYDTTGGNDTQDKIFLLSYAEANKYFGVQHHSVSEATDNTKSRVQTTAYAIAQGAYTNSRYTTAGGAYSGWWWLRSPGYCQYYAANVSLDGSLNFDCVDSGDASVRPAFWLNLESSIF